VNIRQLDLNLLLVFDAIYRERSIGAAAQKLGLSQPAVSNALKRLREFTGDTLFFRTGVSMMPTRTANALAIPISHALATVEESLSAVRSFDPATSTRKFRVGVNDTLRDVLAPALVTLVEREAPNIFIEFVAQTMNPQKLQAEIRAGEMDTGMLPRAVLEDGIAFEMTWSEQLVFVVRHGHWALGEPVTREAMSRLRHVVTGQNNALRHMVDEQFRKHGIERLAVCQTPDTNAIASIVEMSDLVGVMGAGVARRHMRDHPIAILDTPIRLPRVDGCLVWSKGAGDDQGHIWLRTRIAQIVRAAMTVTT